MNIENTPNLPHPEANNKPGEAHHPEDHKSPATSPGDPASITGKITKFLFNAHSDVDGLILDGQHQVHVHPHAAQELMKSAKVGQTVIIQGTKSKSVDLVFAVSIACENGVVVNAARDPKKK